MNDASGMRAAQRLEYLQDDVDRALSCAHAAGIVHRDIKPGNILLIAGGRIKVTDFGIARLDSSHLTLDGVAIGTPRYMSPEQCLGITVDQRSDLFSVAVLLQELLTGERPFAGKTLAEIACNLLRESPAGGDRVTEVAGSAVNNVIQRTLAKAPEDRYASADAMAKALRAATGAVHAEPSAVQDIDQTMIAVRGQVGSQRPPGASTLAPSLVNVIERKLANRVGPIARYLVKTSLPGAASAEALCDVLAQQIDRSEDRRKFLAEALEVVSKGHDATQTAGSSISQLHRLLRSPRTRSNVPGARLQRPWGQSQRSLCSGPCRRRRPAKHFGSCSRCMSKAPKPGRTFCDNGATRWTVRNKETRVFAPAAVRHDVETGPVSPCNRRIIFTDGCTSPTTKAGCSNGRGRLPRRHRGE